MARCDGESDLAARLRRRAVTVEGKVIGHRLLAQVLGCAGKPSIGLRLLGGGDGNDDDAQPPILGRAAPAADDHAIRQVRAARSFGAQNDLIIIFIAYALAIYLDALTRGRGIELRLRGKGRDGAAEQQCSRKSGKDLLHVASSFMKP